MRLECYAEIILSPLSLFALCASDNLVHILLQLGTFHARHTNVMTGTKKTLS